MNFRVHHLIPFEILLEINFHHLLIKFLLTFSELSVKLQMHSTQIVQYSKNLSDIEWICIC